MATCIRRATTEDLEAILSITEQCFYKLDLEKYTVPFDGDSFLKNVKNFIGNENFWFFVYEKNKKVIGFSLGAVASCFFNNNKKQYTDIAIQPDPELNDFTQNKIVVSLLNNKDDRCKEEGIDMANFTLSKKYSVEKWLNKKGYRITEVVYSKKFN